MPTKRDPFATLHNDIARLIDRRAVRSAYETVELLLGELRERARVVSGGANSLTRPVRAFVTSLYNVGSGRVVRAVAQDLASTADEAVRESVGRTARVFSRGFGQASRQLADRANLDELVARRSVQVARSYADDFATTWAPAVARSVQGAMRTALEASASRSATVQMIEDAVRGEQGAIALSAQYQAASAYNGAQSDVIELVQRDYPDLMKRWTEKITDGGVPKDNKVAIDSIVMHAQLAPPAGLFTMPPDPRAPHRFVGRSWPYPPNRPHDRAVVTPWRRGWGQPGWVWRNGQREWLVGP